MPHPRIADYLDTSHQLYELTILVLERLDINHDFAYPLALLKNAELSLVFYAKHEIENVTEATQLASYFHNTASAMARDGIRFMIPPQKTVASQYSIARALCREIRNKDLDVVHALRARFILNIIFNTRSHSDVQLAKISCQLDLVVTSVDPRQSIMTTLSRATNGHSKSILGELKTAVQQNPSLVSEHKPLANVLELIFAIKISPPSVNPRPKRTSHPTLSSRPKISFQVTKTKSDSPDDIDEPQPRNDVSVVIDALMATEENIDPEPTLFVSPDTQHSDEDSDTFDDSETTKFAVQTTARWYSNLINRTPVSPTRFSHLTKKHFVTCWSELATGQTEQQHLALIVGLHYSTGVNIEHILNWTLGKNGTINQNFEYVRQWLSPEGIFAPTADDEHLYDTKINRLDLRFNRRLTDLLSRHLSADSPATLGTQLNIQKNSCIENIKRLFLIWRDAGRYPIKLPKVRAALSTELWVLYRHHPTVYILSSSDIHTPHIINRYQTTNGETLLKRWDDVQNALFQQ